MQKTSPEQLSPSWLAAERGGDGRGPMGPRKIRKGRATGAATTDWSRPGHQQLQRLAPEGGARHGGAKQIATGFRSMPPQITAAQAAPGSAENDGVQVRAQGRGRELGPPRIRASIALPQALINMAQTLAAKEGSRPGADWGWAQTIIMEWLRQVQPAHRQVAGLETIAIPRPGEVAQKSIQRCERMANNAGTIINAMTALTRPLAQSTAYSAGACNSSGITDAHRVWFSMVESARARILWAEEMESEAQCSTKRRPQRTTHSMERVDQIRCNTDKIRGGGRRALESAEMNVGKAGAVLASISTDVGTWLLKVMARKCRLIPSLGRPAGGGDEPPSSETREGAQCDESASSRKLKSDESGQKVTAQLPRRDADDKLTWTPRRWDIQRPELWIDCDEIQKDKIEEHKLELEKEGIELLAARSLQPPERPPSPKTRHGGRVFFPDFWRAFASAALAVAGPQACQGGAELGGKEWGGLAAELEALRDELWSPSRVDQGVAIASVVRLVSAASAASKLPAFCGPIIVVGVPGGGESELDGPGLSRLLLDWVCCAAAWYPAQGSVAPAGAAPAADEAPAAAVPAPARTLVAGGGGEGPPVLLNVYDVSHADAVRWLNSLLAGSALKLGGAFHAAVEVQGLEWSFGRTFRDTLPGVSCQLPRSDPQHTFRESVLLGYTRLTTDRIAGLMADLVEEYPGSGYDLLHRNCCTFAEDFSRRLGVGPIQEAHVTPTRSSPPSLPVNWGGR
ncbi:unnamed protein product, partial [Prorocentrum cordatum]